MKSSQALTFKHLENRETIAGINNLYDLLKRKGIINYQAYQKSTQSGITEFRGIVRPAQEDRGTLGLLNLGYLPVALTDEDYITALRETTAVLEDTIEQLSCGVTEGSTMCAVIIDKLQIYTANLGDSTAFLCVLDASGKTVQFKQINTTLHNPWDPVERARLLSLLDEDIFMAIRRSNRLPSNHDQLNRGKGLNVSRTLGDEACENYGLIHEPDIYTNTVNIPKGGKAFVIVACDGLTELHHVTNKDIQTIIEDTHRLPPDEIAKRLTMAAFNKGSTDNISVAVTALNRNEKQQKYLAIFDGHSGSHVSELACYLFDVILTFKLQCLLLRKFLNLKLEFGPIANRFWQSLQNVCADLPKICGIHHKVETLRNYYEQYITCLIKLFDSLVNHQSIVASHPLMDSLTCFAHLPTIFSEVEKKYAGIQFTGNQYDNYTISRFPEKLEEELSKQIVAASKHLDNGNIEEIKRIYDDLKLKADEMKYLYDAANIYFMIKSRFNNANHSCIQSGNKIKELYDAYDYNYLFIAPYPEKNAVELIENIKSHLQNIYDSIELTSFTTLYQFFKSDDRLKVEIKTAINELNDLSNLVKSTCSDKKETFMDVEKSTALTGSKRKFTMSEMDAQEPAAPTRSKRKFS